VFGSEFPLGLPVDTPYWRYLIYLFLEEYPKGLGASERVKGRLVREDVVDALPIFYDSLEKLVKEKPKKELIEAFDLFFAFDTNSGKCMEWDKVQYLFFNFRHYIDIFLFSVSFKFDEASELISDKLKFVVDSNSLGIYAHYFFDPMFVYSYQLFTDFLQRCRNFSTSLPYFFAHAGEIDAALCAINARRLSKELMLQRTAELNFLKFLKVAKIDRDRGESTAKEMFLYTQGIAIAQRELGKATGDQSELQNVLDKFRLEEDKSVAKKKVVFELPSASQSEEAKK